jgi:chromate transporter
MIKLVGLYWVLLQSMVASFTGLSSLPVIRHELVVERHWVTDQDLNAAVMIGRSTPGPMGVYIVSVGYFVAGWPGAVAGMLAMATPALLVLLLMRVLKGRDDHPRMKSAIRFVILGGSAYSAAVVWAMSRATLVNWWTAALAVVAAGLLLKTRVHTIWILCAAGAVGLMLK